MSKSKATLDPSSAVMYDHAVTLYSALEGQSVDGPDNTRIFEGKVVETFGKLGISMTHYTPLFNSLKELGSVELLERGARGRPTRYRLLGAPSQDAFAAMYLTATPRPATIPLEGLEQRISNIERRLDGIDIKGVLVDMERRLRKLEGGSK